MRKNARETVNISNRNNGSMKLLKIYRRLSYCFDDRTA
jgi:hypothetical protein